ncbi:MAG: hypothetical protein ACKO7P_11750, partial [Bacteroidota bacterium]
MMDLNKGFILRKFCVVIFILISSISLAQSDSLDRCIDYLNKAQIFYLENKLADSDHSAQLGWELSQKIGNEELMSRACFWLSENARNMGKETEAFEFAIRGKYLGERSSETYYVACHLALLRALYDQELWTLTNEFCEGFKSTAFISVEDQSEIIFFKSNGLVYTSQSKQALKEIRDFQALHSTQISKMPVWEEKLLSLSVESAIMANAWKDAEVNCLALMKRYYGNVDKAKRIKWNGWLAQIYLHKKEYKQAIELYNKSMLLCSDADLSFKLPLLINMAECSYLSDNLVEAQQYLDLAIDMSERLSDYYYQALCNVFLSAINNKKGWINYSIDYAQQALNFAEKADDLDIHYEMHNLLSKYQAMNNKPELSLYHQQESQKVLKEIMKRRQEESLRQSVRQNKLQGREYWIRSDVDAQRERKRMTELK